MDDRLIIKAFREGIGIVDGRITAIQHTPSCWTLDYYSESGQFIETWQLSRLVQDHEGITFDANPVIDLTGEQKRIVESLWPTWEGQLRKAVDQDFRIVDLEEQSLGFGLYWRAEPDIRTWCGNSLDAMEQLSERFGFTIEWKLVDRGGLVAGRAYKNDP